MKYYIRKKLGKLHVSRLFGRKRALTGLVVLMFLVSAVSALNSVSAHFTLGDYRADGAFHENDFDPHIPGPLAYVWPGSGLAAFTGNPAGFPPGYQTPYSTNPPGQPESSYQLAGTAYAPFGAILTSTDDHQSRGPLIFALNFSRPCDVQGVVCDESGNVLSGSRLFNYTGVTIYIAPEFDLSSPRGNIGLVQTTFSATSTDFYLGQSSWQDPIGPNWWVLFAQGDIQFWPQHNYAEWYYIKVNDVVAPKIAGKYFFKVFLWDNEQMDVPGGWNTASQIAGGLVQVPTSGPTALTVPVENWPVLLVKGEVDPGIVTGTIRFGTFNTTLYGKPITLSGRVRLVGSTINPYTGESIGRSVEARGYFNASAAGHYEVEGVAPGIYTIYASAAGYPEQAIASDVKILAGQSFHIDGYLDPGAVVHGQIFSKKLFGEEAWPSDPRPVLVELYSSNNYGGSTPSAWSPWNKTHAPYMAYDWPKGSNVPEPLPVAFPWDAVAPDAFSYYSRFFGSPPLGSWISHGALSCGDNPTPTGNVDPCGKPDGVGPAQYWWVDGSGVFTNGGGPTSFIYSFGVKGVYGAPTEYDGHVPQPYATWVNGLTAGRYWVRAWVNGYTQTLQDGITLDEYYFDIAKDEWAGDVYMPMDLRIGGTVCVTIHFHDFTDTLQECPINGCPGNLAQGGSAGNRYLVAELRDSNRKLMGLNFTYVDAASSSATVQINGFGMFGPDPNKANMKFSYLRYTIYQGLLRDYGLPSGTYTLYVYMRGYLPQTREQFTVTLNSAICASTNLYRGARFDVTMYSVDWEQPRIQREWEFPGASINIFVYRDGTSITSFGFSQPAGLGGSFVDGGCGLAPGEVPDHCRFNQNDGSTAIEDGPDTKATAGYVPWDQQFFTGGFLTYPGDYRLSDLNGTNVYEGGTYKFTGYAYGYVQHGLYSVFVQRGGFADIKMDLIKGVNITLNIPFKTEGIYAPTQFNMSMRIRIYDDQGRVVATALSKRPGSNIYINTQPLGIGRFAESGGTYYVDPAATSPSIANGLTSTDGSGKTADTFLWHGTWNGVTGWQAFDSDIDHDGVPDFSTYNTKTGAYNTWIPAGTDQVRVFIAGLYDTSDPLSGTPALKVSPERYFQQYGIEGYANTITDSYAGSWTVEVDTWNEYPAPRFSSITGAPLTTNWYPPSPPNLEGLLEGDSFHTIPDHPAGPFGYVGTRLQLNGLGPYAQRSVWTIPNAHLGSEASAIYELDKRGFISGNIMAFTWSNELRTESWLTLQATTANGTQPFTQYSWDAHYEMYLDQGDYDLSVYAWDANANQGYKTVSAAIHVSDGQSSILTFQLEESKIPVPEFKALGVSIASVLVVSFYVLRRKQH